MAIKKITNWKDPIWTQQECESDRANFYRQQYEKTTYTITAFEDIILNESLQCRLGKGSVKVHEIIFLPDDAKYNVEHQEEIKLYIETNGEKGKPCKPSPKVIDQWAGCHRWKIRRRAFKDNFKEEVIQEVKDDIVDKLKEIIHLELDNTILTLNNQKETLQDKQDNKRDYKAKAQAETNKLLQDSLFTKVNPFENEEEAEDDSFIPVDDNPQFEDKAFKEAQKKALREVFPT